MVLCRSEQSYLLSVIFWGKVEIRIATGAETREREIEVQNGANVPLPA
jgi:hypothetical protein